MNMCIHCSWLQMTSGVTGGLILASFCLTRRHGLNSTEKASLLLVIHSVGGSDHVLSLPDGCHIFTCICILTTKYWYVQIYNSLYVVIIILSDFQYTLLDIKGHFVPSKMHVLAYSSGSCFMLLVMKESS